MRKGLVIAPVALAVAVAGCGGTGQSTAAQPASAAFSAAAPKHATVKTRSGPLGTYPVDAKGDAPPVREGHREAQPVLRRLRAGVAAADHARKPAAKGSAKASLLSTSAAPAGRSRSRTTATRCTASRPTPRPARPRARASTGSARCGGSSRRPAPRSSPTRRPPATEPPAGTRRARRRARIAAPVRGGRRRRARRPAGRPPPRWFRARGSRAPRRAAAASAGPQRRAEPADLARGDAEQAGDERMGAEAAVADADRVLRTEDRGEQRVAVAGQGERRHAHAVDVVAGQSASCSRPGTDARPPRSRSASARSCAATASIPSAPSARQAAPSATAPTTFGRPGLVALRRVGPDDAVERHELDRAAAVQQRRGVAEPADGPDERAGAERRVELVAREREEVDARGGHVDRPVRRELRGVDEQPRAVAMRDGGEPRERPHLAGDVRRAGHRDEVERGRARAARARRRRTARRRTRGTAAVRRSWRRQGSMLAWCSTGLLSTRAPAGSAAASTLIASVVLRTKTTSSPAGAPTNSAHDVARALERLGGDLRLAPAAAVDAAVPGHERLHGVPDLRQRGRARGVVEVHVAARAAVRAHDLGVGSEEPHVGASGSFAGEQGVRVAIRNSRSAARARAAFRSVDAIVSVLRVRDEPPEGGVDAPRGRMRAIPRSRLVRRAERSVG